MLTIPQSQVASDQILGHVLLADYFGNLISNIRGDQIHQLGNSEQLLVSCKEWTICGVSRTYGDRRPGELIALLGSQGRLEMAARLVGAELGTSVVVRRQ